MAAVENATKAPATEQIAQPAQSRGEVAIIAPPRLPYHPSIQERFGVDRAGWRALVEAIFPAARSPDSVILALSYCKARKLDIFKRPVHIVPIWSSEKRGYIESIWPGIGELRTTAFRTGLYAGCDETKFGPDEKATLSGRVKIKKDEWKDATVTISYPSWAQVTVWRLVGGQRVAFPGPRCYWRASYGRKQNTELPNDRWETAPSYMLEKVSEAAALRKAFPEEIGDMPSDVEAESNMVDITPDIERPAAPAAPTRAQFRPAEEEPPHDAETGEIVEQVEPFVFTLTDAQGATLAQTADAKMWAQGVLTEMSKATTREALDAVYEGAELQFEHVQPHDIDGIVAGLQEDHRQFAANLAAAAQAKAGKARKPAELV